MKKLLIIFALLIPATNFANIIHPMDYNGSQTQKDKVISLIKKRVKKDYCESGIDMCQDTILRMMERENLSAFKNATTATNRKIMDRVIKDYCYSGLDMCNYSTIWMMYNENLQASSQELSW